MSELAFQLYQSCLEIAVPVAFVFEMGNLIVGTVIRAATGGRLFFGR